MADMLFPVFDIPDIEEEEEDVEKYKPSVYFDFEKGDFILDGAHRMVEADGREAYIQWCLKMIETEREEYLAYNEDLGTEFEEIANLGVPEEKESEIENTIIDALMEHPCTEYVGDFVFEHEADSCWVTFTVKGYDMDEEVLSTPVPEL